MNQKDLKDLINKTIFSVAIDDARPILKGCLFEIAKDHITSVALDGYRLAMAKKPIKSTTAEFSTIVPARTLGEIVKNEIGFKDVFYTIIGSIIGSHAGPGLISFFYHGKNRTPEK